MSASRNEKAGTPIPAPATPINKVDRQNDPRVSEANLNSDITKMAAEMGVDAAYRRKVVLFNQAIKDEIGFGRFQLWLTFLAGFGWAVGNFWFQALSMSLPQIKLEFGSKYIQFAALALHLGLFCGATFWGIAADIIGRRFSWNVTLLLSAIFGVAVGGTPNFVGLGGLLGALGVGVGGQLPIDGVMLMEFLPESHYWILTFLSIFWCLGQLLAAEIGWALYHQLFMRGLNMGWRYTWFFLGGFTVILAVLHFIAKEKGKKTTLTLEQLKAARAQVIVSRKLDEKSASLDASPKEKGLEDDVQAEQVDKVESQTRPSLALGTEAKWSERSELRELRASLRQFDASHVKALFSSFKMAWNTVLICLLWGLIGLAYPLYNLFVASYLKNVGATRARQRRRSSTATWSSLRRAAFPARFSRRPWSRCRAPGGGA
ncbi:hypothetical protein ACQY0O_000244 [Thecaphora frezii]